MSSTMVDVEIAKPSPTHLGIPQPHPIYGISHISYQIPPSATTAQFRVVDLSGKIIYKKNLFQDEGVLTFDSHFVSQSGLYFGQLLINGMVVQNQKMVMVAE